MALITCRDLCLAYEGEPAVIENLNIEVKEGDYLCILGENGSGKSTLLKGLLGLKAPTSGEIILGDGLKQSEIGYLPQQSSVQREFPASVYEVVLSGCLNQTGFFSFYKKEHRELVDKNMELLDIKDLKKRCYKDLSGGQQQRVLLARALCATKKLLILDEPVTGLDPLVTAELYELIQKINKQEGITIVMVSHDLQNAISQAKTILHLGETVLYYGDVKGYCSSTMGNSFIGGSTVC